MIFTNKKLLEIIWFLNILIENTRGLITSMMHDLTILSIIPLFTHQNHLEGIFMFLP